MSVLTGNEEINQITQKVIGCLYTVSNTPGGGFLEKIYQNAAQCLNYLRATGLPVCLLVNFYRPKLEIKRIIPHASWKS